MAVSATRSRGQDEEACIARVYKYKRKSTLSRMRRGWENRRENKKGKKHQNVQEKGAATLSFLFPLLSFNFIFLRVRPLQISNFKFQKKDAFQSPSKCMQESRHKCVASLDRGVCIAVSRWTRERGEQDSNETFLPASRLASLGLWAT